MPKFVRFSNFEHFWKAEIFYNWSHLHHFFLNHCLEVANLMWSFALSQKRRARSGPITKRSLKMSFSALAWAEFKRNCHDWYLNGSLHRQHLRIFFRDWCKKNIMLTSSSDNYIVYIYFFVLVALHPLCWTWKTFIKYRNKVITMVIRQFSSLEQGWDDV